MRRTTAIACAAVAALVLSGCSGSSDSAGVPGSRQNSGAAGAGSATVDKLVAAQQPASASQLPAGSTAAGIRAKGTLTVGGTQTAALFSLLNPTTGKVEGFDAALSRLLAKYITGKDSVKRVNVTTQTREALLKNHSVDAVFATYTITPSGRRSSASRARTTRTAWASRSRSPRPGPATSRTSRARPW
ncbi:transporter substrate-binding domain-containing protein [Streptomyces sp. M19]